MTTPIISDGKYKFLNLQYTDFAADLIDANPVGPISGYENNDLTANNQWNVVNVGTAGNQITLESVAAPGSFAKPVIETSGGPITGSTERYTWTVSQVADNQFQLETGDGGLVWEYSASYNYFAILLRPNKFEGIQEWSTLKIN